MPENPKRNRKNLVKSELEYSNYFELEEESSSINEEDRSLIKRKDTEDDNDNRNGEKTRLYDNLRKNNSMKINSSSSSTPPEKTSYGDSSNDSKDNNSKYTSISNMLSLKTIITSFIFMGLVMALQEAYSFTDGNNIVHSFLNSSIVYKYEGGFYSASQILTHKDNNKDYIWGLMVLLTLGLTIKL
jgi:hypothetical protein